MKDREEKGELSSFTSGERIIYMDNAATTRISDEVLSGMMPYLTENYGNASAIYSLGLKSRNAIEEARKKVAESINAEPDEIYFTSGGTESDNWALVGTFENLEYVYACSAPSQLFGIITSRIEHHAVIDTVKYLRNEYGALAEQVGVDKDGIVSVEKIRLAMTYLMGSGSEQCTTLCRIVSIMAANNETGVIQPIEEIGELCKKQHPGIIFHTDAVQAYGHIPIDVKKMNIDLLSVSGHKVHAPKGTGFLYVRRGSLDIDPFMHGGAQERKRRAGTENVAGIVGLGIAAERCSLNNGEAWEDMTRIKKIRDHLLERIMNEVKGCRINGTMDKRLPNNLNVSFDGIEGESLAMALSLRGICVSTGSACTTGDMNPSYVLKEMGLTDEKAHGALRITLSRYNTMEEADIVVDAIKEEVGRLRRF